jgi:hypothetical protein
MNSSIDRGEVKISALDRADREDAIALLTRALIDDPLMAFIMEDLKTEARVEKGLNALMDYRGGASLMSHQRVYQPLIDVWGSWFQRCPSHG